MINKIVILLFFPLLINAQPAAFISANERICDNAGFAIVKIDFQGTPPFTFIYAINGIEQASITTHNKKYCISTKIDGIYTLKSFRDAFHQGDMNGSGEVTVVSAPTAIIHLLSDTLSVLYPQSDFISQSLGSIIEQKWNFGDNSDELIEYNPHHIFPVDQFGIGISTMYESSLIVTDDMGCSDTTKHQVWVREEYYMYMPNAFTPDGNDINDKFCIDYHAIREQSFLVKIYSSIGELIYQTTNPLELNCKMEAGWDGKHYKTKNDLPSDTYMYEIYYQDFEGWKYDEYGSIILIR
jgi:gliding motility-associated-like protein